MNIAQSPELPLSFQRRSDLFEQIKIPHSKIDLTLERIQTLIAQTESALQRNRVRGKSVSTHVLKRDELWILPIIGPSGSTKSTTLGIVEQRLLAGRAAGASAPILIVTIKSDVRDMVSLQSAILEAFRDRGARGLSRTRDYSEPAVNAGISRIARTRGTTVIVFDEAHNMLSEGKPSDMAVALKSLVNDGVFSIALVGTEKIRSLFHADQELLGRCKVPIIFDPPTSADRRQCISLFKFAEKLCQEMLRMGVIDQPFCPTDTVEHCALLYDMTDGNLGRFGRIIRNALDLTFSRGVPFLDWQTFEEAYSAWQELDGTNGYNPIKNGVRKGTVKAVRELVEAMQ